MLKTILIAAVFLFIASTVASGGDIQSYTPKTPAGGAYVPASSYLEDAIAVELGSDGYTRRSYAESQEADTLTLVFDRDGNVIQGTDSKQTIQYDR